jgi:hypothetical protein
VLYRLQVHLKNIYIIYIATLVKLVKLIKVVFGSLLVSSAAMQLVGFAG